MGLFSKVFSRSKTSANDKKASSVFADESTISGSLKSSGSSDFKSNWKRGGFSSDEPPAEVGTTVHPGVRVARALVDLYNNKDLSVEDMGKLFVCDEKKRYVFEEGMRLTPVEVAQMLLLIRSSFPDFKFTYDSIEVEANNKVTVEGLKAFGTHTAAPFAFPPGVVPPISAAGVFCENDEERVWLELDKNWKIKTCHIIAMGDKTGPIGLYEQIGGSPPGVLPK